MSVETNDHDLPKPKSHRKSNQEKIEKKERKRRAIEEIEPKPSQKKHQVQPQGDNIGSKIQEQIPGPIPNPQNSPFHEQTSSLYLPIAPIAQSHPIRALCAEHISPLLLSYYPPFHGVLISYSNPRLSSSAHDISTVDGRQKAFARSVDEYAASFVWLTAEFLIFRPQRGDVIEGYINLQSESNIGIVYWNFFNASIERKFLPKDWKWIPSAMSARRSRNIVKLKKAAKSRTDMSEDGEEDDLRDKQAHLLQEDDVGHFLTGKGKRIEGRVRFYVRHVDTSRSTEQEHRFLGVEGTMLS